MFSDLTVAENSAMHALPGRSPRVLGPHGRGELRDADLPALRPGRHRGGPHMGARMVPWIDTARAMMLPWGLVPHLPKVARKTDAEIAAAKAYWMRVWRAGRGDVAAERDAFVELCGRVGVNRALWVARATQPDESTRPAGPDSRGAAASAAGRAAR